MKTPRALAALSVLTLGASLTALASPPTEAAPAPGRVKVSQVAASAEAAPRGTQVTVSFALANTKANATTTRRVVLSLVDAAGRSHAFGATYVPPLRSGATRRFTATRPVTDAVAGDYRVKVCFPKVARGTCATTPGAPVSITPAVLTLGSDTVSVPAASEGNPTPGARLLVTSTGQAPTGALSVALDAVEVQPESRAASTDFQVADSTTCGPSLAPGRTCRVDVTRTETSSGSARAVLTVTGTRAPAASVPVVRFLDVRLSPSSLDFGDVAVGESRQLTFELVNDSDEEVSTGGDPGSNGDFSFDFTGPFTCLVPVPARSSCTITVRFAPQQMGLSTSTLSIFADETVLTLPVSGTGTPGEAQPVRPGAARGFGTR